MYSPLRLAYGSECRTGLKQGAETSVWWQVQFPAVFKVDRYDTYVGQIYVFPRTLARGTVIVIR